MDISTPRRPVSPPAAGDLRLIYEDGYLRAIDPNGRKMRLRVEAGTPVLAVAASLEADTAGDDNSLTFTAVTAGLSGNGISVVIEVTGVNNPAAECYMISETEIFIGLATDGNGDSISTAADVIAAVEASDEVSGLVTVANTDPDDGTGIVGPMERTFLSGGIDATPGISGDEMADASYRYLAVADIGKTSTSGWRKTAHAAL